MYPRSIRLLVSIVLAMASLSATLSVQPAQATLPPELRVSQTLVHVGQRVTLRGTHFWSRTHIQILLGNSKINPAGNYGRTVTSGSGTFTITVTLARYPGGQKLSPGLVLLVAGTPPRWQQTASVPVQLVK